MFRGIAQSGPVFDRIFDPATKTRILEKSGKSEICDFSGLAHLPMSYYSKVL